MNRHFKKYYFYFLARTFDAVGSHHKSVPYYAETIRFRSFFWDSQTRYAEAIAKSPKKITLQIQGGIGDFLQFLPFILKHKSYSYTVLTHFLYAESFFKILGVKIKKYYFYTNWEDYVEIRDRLQKVPDTYVCPRTLFFKSNPFISTKKKALKKPSVIGIHMGSSKLAAGKALSPDFVLKVITWLMRAKYKIILFGTKDELKSLHIKTHRAISLAQDQNVVKNLSLVNQCDLMIASDSVFKTMASMLKIPSIVLHKDNANHFRDRTFIEPYVKAHCMSVYKYKSLEGKEVDTALAFTIEAINRLFKAS
jgi:ADP-heptose:LPS heptosyltransferase